MYVNPFWFGVFTTLVVEIVVFIGYAIVFTNRGKRK